MTVAIGYSQEAHVLLCMTGRQCWRYHIVGEKLEAIARANDSDVTLIRRPMNPHLIVDRHSAESRRADEEIGRQVLRVRIILRASGGRAGIRILVGIVALLR